ncbi:hypothetical protein B296_00048329 [Ensete ventricosum]|uniref:Protein kinase domain-containing protein n=1 Tax=Ensete ventricosum TaxID=4639 RepID=A0A426WW45_ENSVE|nr:hypothetical protein B296_00048329 [Ensete ventricosum]
MHLLDCDSSPVQSPLHPSRLHTKDNGPLQTEVLTSAYKTHSYLQTKIGHKANQTRAAKPTVSLLLTVQVANVLVDDVLDTHAIDYLTMHVADFGFARLGINEAGVTHISTQVKGTAGYLDPEYLRTYQLTDKSDVYSFGVLLVELMSSRRPIERRRELKERVTIKWVYPLS